MSNVGMDIDVAIRRVGRMYQAMDAQQRSGSTTAGNSSAASTFSSMEEEGPAGVLRVEDVDRALVVKRLLAKLPVASGYVPGHPPVEVLPPQAKSVSTGSRTWHVRPEHFSSHHHRRGTRNTSSWVCWCAVSRRFKIYL